MDENDDSKVRTLRRSMGLSDLPPHPIESPQDQICEEIQKTDRVKVIILTACLVLAFVFMAVLIFDS